MKKRSSHLHFKRSPQARLCTPDISTVLYNHVISPGMGDVVDYVDLFPLCRPRINRRRAPRLNRVLEQFNDVKIRFRGEKRQAQEVIFSDGHIPVRLF